MIGIKPLKPLQNLPVVSAGVNAPRHVMDQSENGWGHPNSAAMDFKGQNLAIDGNQPTSDQTKKPLPLAEVKSKNHRLSKVDNSGGHGGRTRNPLLGN